MLTIIMTVLDPAESDDEAMGLALTCSVYSTRWTPRIMFRAAHMIFRTNERIPGAVTGSSRTFGTGEHKNRPSVGSFLLHLLQCCSLLLAPMKRNIFLLENLWGCCRDANKWMGANNGERDCVCLAVCSGVLPDPGPCSTCPFPMPLLSSTSSKLSMIFGGRIFRSSWTSASVTSRAGPPLWLYCCLSFWIVPSVSWHKEPIRSLSWTVFLWDLIPRIVFHFNSSLHSKTGISKENYSSAGSPNSKKGYGRSAKATTEALKHAENSQRRSSKKQKALATGRLWWHTLM